MSSNFSANMVALAKKVSLMETPHNAIISALRAEGVRVVKATLQIRSGCILDARLTRKTKKILRDKALNRILMLDILREWSAHNLGAASDRSRWLVRLYPETGAVTVAPFRSNGYPEGTYSLKNLHRFDRMTLSEQIACANHSGRSIIMPDLPHQPDRSVTFHMPQVTHAETILW